MYTVIVVDDEEWALAGAMQTFPFAELGFTPLLATTDSSQAALCMRKRRPDLVIADIRMPEVSGLGLLEQARGEGLDSLFILLSGYSEFAYAQQAITLGAFSYCLKPIKPEAARSELSRARDALQARAGEAQRVENQRFQALLAYVEANFREPVQLKTLCERFSLHPAYCSRLFTQTLGCGFSEYLTRLRMGEAKRLLLTRRYAVKQVAEMAGYTDYYYFTKVYTKYYGISPAKTKKAALHE